MEERQTPALCSPPSPPCEPCPPLLGTICPLPHHRTQDSEPCSAEPSQDTTPYPSPAQTPPGTLAGSCSPNTPFRRSQQLLPGPLPWPVRGSRAEGPVPGEGLQLVRAAAPSQAQQCAKTLHKSDCLPLPGSTHLLLGEAWARQAKGTWQNQGVQGERKANCFQRGRKVVPPGPGDLLSCYRSQALAELALGLARHSCLSLFISSKSGCRGS